MIFKISCSEILGFFKIATLAAATSTKLCEGISVAIPTAIPEAPFNKTKGSRAGSKAGSVKDPS